MRNRSLGNARLAGFIVPAVIIIVLALASVAALAEEKPVSAPVPGGAADTPSAQPSPAAPESKTVPVAAPAAPVAPATAPAPSATTAQPAPDAPAKQAAPAPGEDPSKVPPPQEPAPAKTPAAVDIKPKGLDPRVRVAVFRISMDGVDQKMAPLVTDSVMTELLKVPNITPVGPSELESHVIGDLQKQVYTCSDGPCIATIGKAAGARKAVSGSLVKMGDTLVFTLKLLDLEGVGSRVEGMWNKKYKGGTGPEVLDVIPEAVQGLFPDAATADGAAKSDKPKADKKGGKPISESTRKFNQIAAYTSLGLSVACFTTAIVFAFQAKDIYEGLSSGRYPPDQIPGKVADEKQAENVQTFTLVGGGLFAALSGYFIYKGWFAKTSAPKTNNDQYHWMETRLDRPSVDYVSAMVSGNGAVFMFGGRY